MRPRDELIVKALVGLGVIVTVQQLREARSIVFKEVKELRSAGGRRPLGRASLFDAPLLPWQKWRRARERESGFSDPVLLKLGLSALPDAPPRPPKPGKLPEPPKPEKPPKPPKPEKPPKPPKPPKQPKQPKTEKPPESPKPLKVALSVGSPSWAASASWVVTA